MTKAKTTKRALLMSVLSMLLCVSMLVGSTFAWFTDSVTSGVNKIVAGNLDVEVTHTNKAVKDQPLQDAGDLFPVTLWEPGVVSYETFTVTNKGTLAFDYAFNFTASDFNKVVLADGATTEYSLKDVIRIGVIEGAVAEGMTRQQLIDAVKAVSETEGSAAKNFAAFESFKYTDYMQAAEKDGNPAQAEKTFTVVAYWEPNVKNDDDYNVNNGKTVDILNDGEKQLYIDIVVDVQAKQRTYESDSFDNQYDRLPGLIQDGYVEVQDGAALAAAIEKGEKIVLTSDVTVDTIIQVEAGETAVIDLNGQKISGTEQRVFNVTEGGKAELSNGTVESKGYGVVSTGGDVKLTNMNIKSGNYAVYANSGSSVEMTSCEFVVSDPESDAVAVNKGSSVKLTNVKIKADDCGVISKGDNNSVEVIGCEIHSDFHGVYHNGSNAPATITIKDTTIVDTASSGVYISNSTSHTDLQTLIIDNCNITGEMTAVEVKHTNATITNSILTATLNNDEIDEESLNKTQQGVTAAQSSVSAWGYAFASTINKNEVGKGRGTVTLTGNAYNIPSTITRASIHGTVTDDVAPIYTEPGVTLKGSDFPTVD